MSYTTPAGTKFYVTSTFAAAKTATNVTNGNPAVVTSTSHGGDMKTVSVNPLARRNGFVLPDGFNPVTIGFTIGHDVSLSNWDTLLNLSRTQTLVGYKSVKPNGAVTYAYGYFIMSEVAKQSSGAVDFVDASFFAQGRTISYA